MRIGVDMVGWQDPRGRVRGIGRYIEQFVDSLTRFDSENEYVLYCFERFAPWSRPVGERGAIRIAPSIRGRLSDDAQAIVDRNPDRLDLYVVTSPFSKVGGYFPPMKTDHRIRVASILYDLTPMLMNREFHLGTDAGCVGDYFERIARLRNYDLILSISESTRMDAIRHLAIPERRVVNISSATREGFFESPRSSELPNGLKAIGVAQPYVLGIASGDAHKNTVGLIRAFALLSPNIRDAHQLVIVGGLAREYERELIALARANGIGDRLLLSGRMSDEALREAYQHCALFAFVSHYEGFGLPIVEAMLCGAPVVAGDNSSQIEVAAGASLLARTHSAADIAEKIGRILTDPDLASSLRRQGLHRAGSFTWRETVRRARAAFQALPPARGGKPLIALFAPPRSESCIDGNPAFDLPVALRNHYSIHIYHVPGDMPAVALANSEFGAFDHRLFENHDRLWNYHAVVCILDRAGRRGNGFNFHSLLRRPDIVALDIMCPIEKVVAAIDDALDRSWQEPAAQARDRRVTLARAVGA